MRSNDSGVDLPDCQKEGMAICARPMEKRENPTVSLLVFIGIQLVYNENYRLLKKCIHPVYKEMREQKLFKETKY